MLDSDSAIVLCETILEIMEGVTIRRPLHGYRDRVAVWYLVINSRKRRNFTYYTTTFQFDWLRAVFFQLNLKYLHVKITNLLRVVV